MDVNAVAVISSSIACGLSTVAIGAMWWDIRSIKKDMRDCINEQNSCQKALPKEYAAKSEIPPIWNKIDNHENRISHLEGVRNGAH